MKLLTCTHCNKEFTPRKCLNCAYYSPLYYKYESKYSKLDFGRCILRQCKQTKEISDCLDFDYKL